MKKLFDSKFLFIVALSLVVLIILGVGAFYLFDDSDDTFVKSGYVLNPMSAKVEKYFFNENTSYKENLSSMIVFKDVDNKDASILKDSFLHYNDGSLSFLNNGAILDLNSISKTSEAVNFYNITSKSIINKSGSGYIIKNASNDINLKNFIGRISDDKYIVVGSLEAKIPGNEKNITGDYFEIVYTEEGIVNIENKDVKYQVTAEGTIIYAGDIAIDLGAKKISKNGEDVMSITAITINGDENIEIIPEEEKNEDEQPNSGEDTTDGNGNGNNPGDGEGEGGTGKDSIDVDREDTVTISLKDASVGSTNVNVTFDIYNQKETDKFTLKVTNLETGRTADVIESVLADEEIRVNLLSPNTKYLFTVINESDNNKYFQKIFETNSFGIKLEKSYATDSELGYKITIDEGTDITNAKLSLYKYNEETKRNEIVTTSYYDSAEEKAKTIEKVTNLSSLGGNIEGVHEIVYDGLDSNTIYTAVLDEFSVVSSNFKDVYNIAVTSLTLKQTPSFSNMVANKDMAAGSFKLSLDNIVDPDNAILSYTYLIYEDNDANELVIPKIVKTNASPVEIKVGDEENQLKNDTNYFYRVIIEYYDNEKYIEYIINDKITFVMGSDPYVTVVPRDDLISYDRIAATIYLTDNSCLISMPNREKCYADTNSTYVEVYKVNSILGEEESTKRSVFSELVDFQIDSNGEIKYELNVSKLQSGTTYEIVVRAFRNDQQSENRVVIEHSEKSRQAITTKSLASFVSDWADQGSSANHVINLKTKFLPLAGTGTMTPEESASSISKVVVKLYDGNNVENLHAVQPIKTIEFNNTEEFNIKENFYDNGYTITSDGDFELLLSDLKTEGKLSEYYTLAIYAYYDDNESSEIRIDNNVIAYRVSPVLLLENVNPPDLTVTEITKKASGLESNLLDDGTIVGYNVLAGFDRVGLISNGMEPKEINIYVYNDYGERVKFYIMDSSHNLKLVDKINAILDESGYYDNKIYMGSSTEYGITDTIMSRGNKYHIGYELILDDSGIRLLYPTNLNDELPFDYGVYETVEPLKEKPVINMYIAKSTGDTITYRYQITDPDNALYREGITYNYGLYYTVNYGIEQKLDIEMINDSERKFSGDITLTNLNNGDEYALYSKINIIKNVEYSDEIMYYSGDNDEGMRIFDGYYNLDETTYYFSYEVINNPLTDNRVYIKILGDYDILDRVISYKITFTDSEGHTPIVIEKWDLESCLVDDSNEPRCIAVDYSDINSMKSDINNDNLITVTVDAIYDNGLTGYDYTVGEGKEYQYMILQNNLIPGTNATYVSLSEQGNVDNWSSAFGISKGYYTYSKLTDKISYRRRDAYSNTAGIGFILTASGYKSSKNNNITLNPKMLSTTTVYSYRNTFLFYSYTPKIKVSNATSLVNGMIADMELISADINDFCEENSTNTCINKNNSEFYLYIDVWENEADIGNSEAVVIPTVKVKINRNNPSQAIKALISGVHHDGKYYYQIYADLNKNGRKERTQLFSATYRNEYKIETYNFSTLSANDIYHDFSVIYKPNMNGNYGDKLLTTTFNLIAYKNNVDFNFDFAYAFCNLSDENCGIDTTSSNIFKSELNEVDLSTSFSDMVDITSYNLEYNKNYKILAYIIYDYYDNQSNQMVKYELLLNGIDSTVNLKGLTTPDFVVSRKALHIDDDYLIEFNINVNDPDRVLRDGKYFVKLLDSNGNVVGDLQVKNSDGTYTTVSSNGQYENYQLDATVTNKAIRIKGLQKNSAYTIYVTGIADINNANLSVSAREVEISKSHLVYSTNDLGVALGEKALATATANSMVITFLGGSNFDNVRELTFTRGLWENGTLDSTFSYSYVIGEDNKNFEVSKDNGGWQFVIDPPGLENEPDVTYKVILQFDIQGSNVPITINTEAKYVPSAS